jgi:hypothetical protein
VSDQRCAVWWISGRDVEEALARLMSLPAARKEAMVALTRSGCRVTALLIQRLQDIDQENRQAAAARRLWMTRVQQFVWPQ